MYGQLLVVADAEALARASAQPSPPQVSATAIHESTGSYE